MQRTIRRLALATLFGVVVFALAAGYALATTVTSEPASQVKTTSAVLNGVIDTGGVATAWEFQWGRTTSYGSATSLDQIAAGQGIVSISATIGSLSPNTTYHFRLITTTGTGSPYYPLNITYGGDLTFTTRTTGKLLLLHTHLVITNNAVSVPLRCASGLRCAGRFTINTRAKLQNRKTFATVLCATRSYKIHRHKTKRPTATVRGACISLLRASTHHSITAKLTSNPRTGQRAVIKKVILILG